jgi:enediyne biosynthesis protein E4
MGEPTMMSARRLAACLLVLPVAPSPATETATTRFVDVTETAALTHAFEGEWEYMVGGGAAIFDCDGNGLADVYLAGGSGIAAFFRNVGEMGGDIRFARHESGPHRYR